MAKVRFLDGELEIDEPLVGPISEVADGAPERITFREAMHRLGRWQEKQILRNAQSRVIDEHFRRLMPF